jgi:small subunit ribosomal protein S20
MPEETQEVEKKKELRRSSAKKAQLQSEKRRHQNRSFRANVRTTMKQLRESFSEKDPVKQKKLLQELYKLMDKGAKKAVFTRNKANRIKSRLASQLAAIEKKS